MRERPSRIWKSSSWIETDFTEMKKAGSILGSAFVLGIYLLPRRFAAPPQEGDDSPAALRHPLKRGKGYLILSVDLTLLMSFFKAEVARMVNINATKGKATPALKAGSMMVGSTVWAILGMMK